MPIAYDGKLYEDEYALETGRPVEPRTDDKTSSGTQVPAGENNAPAGSVEAPRGIVDKLLGTTGERYQTWPEKAVRSMIGAAALPGKVSQGLIAPDSIQAIEQSADLAGMMVFGPAPVAGKMAEGTLGSFIGIKAKNFDRNRLAEAQIMEANAAHPDEIWMKTQTFKGADGRWRQEIPDRDAGIKQELNPGGTLRLKDHLDHPELFKAYPELEKVDVVAHPGDRSMANYSSASNTVNVGGEWINNKEVLLHEIQHAIQTTEGFAKGGSVAKEIKLKYDDDLLKAKEEARSLLRARDEVAIGKRDPFTEKEKKRIEELRTIFQKEAQYRAAAAEEARWNYDRLAGEVEARNVETRAAADPNYLRQVPPIRTEDILRQNQHVAPQPVISSPYGYNP